MILYHGSNYKFDNIDLSKAKSHKDFGKGFYLTTNFRQATKWAQVKDRNRAYVYVYRVKKIDYVQLKILELLEYNKEWLDFIVENRINGNDPDYDIIYDRMADNRGDELTRLIRQYSNSEVIVSEVLNRIRFRGAEYNQYCFRTEEAVRSLHREKVITWRKNDKGRWIMS